MTVLLFFYRISVPLRGHTKCINDYYNNSNYNNHFSPLTGIYIIENLAITRSKYDLRSKIHFQLSKTFLNLYVILHIAKNGIFFIIKFIYNHVSQQFSFSNIDAYHDHNNNYIAVTLIILMKPLIHCGL